MRNFTFSGFSRYCIFLAAALLFSGMAFSQTPQYFISKGTSTNSFPLNTSRIKMHIMYLPNDFEVMPVSGSITKIYLRNSSAGVTASTYTNFTVSVLQSDTTSFPFSGSMVPFLTGFTNVLTAPSITLNSSGVAGEWVGIALAQPFNYDNTKTLIVEITYSGKTAGGFETYYTSGGIRKRMYSTASATAISGSTNPGICDFGMDVATSSCPAVLMGGTAQTSNSDPCSSMSFNLGLTGNSSGPGQTYQWQSSPDNTNWTNIPGAESLNFITSQTSSHYYRAAVSCGGATEYSSSVLVSTTPLVSGTFTINNTIATGGSNFESFGDAIAYIACGINGPVVFNVANTGNEYNGQVIIPAINGTSVANNITVNGNGATVRFDAISITNRAGILINGTDHLIIDSLTIDVSKGSQGYGVVITNDADSNIIRKCTVLASTSNDNNAYAGIVISSVAYNLSVGNGGDGNLIEDNTINGGFYGVAASGNTLSLAQNNTIKNNIIKDTYVYPLFLQNNNNLVVSGNDISRPTRTTFPGPPSYTGTSVTYINNCTNLLVEKNRIHNMFDLSPSNTTALYGFDLVSSGGLSPANPNRLENNIMYNINTDGHVYGVSSTQFPFPANSNWNFYHNSFVFDGQQSGANPDNITCGINVFGQNVNVRNNNIYISRNDAGNKYCLHYGAGATGVASSNNNNLYINSQTGNNYVAYFNGAVYTSLASWNGPGNPYDKQSVSVDPLFVAAFNGDLTPTEPQLNDICPAVGVATDILGTVRGSTPDPGAFEFSLPPCINPTSAGLATSNTPFACAGSSFILNLEANNSGAGQTYQWQSSPDNAAWSNIGGPLTTPFLSTTQTQSTYYRCAVTCNAGTTVYTPNILYVITPGLVSGNFTINNTQPTAGNSFNSFSEAISYLSCGINGPVVFDVSPFSIPFNEQIVINAINGTSATNTITFNGNGALLSYSSNSSGDRAAILLNGADHIIIDSFQVDVTAGTYGWGVSLTQGADSNIIRRCHITAGTNVNGNNFAGILICGSFNTLIAGNAGSGNQVLNNTVVGGTYGVAIYGPLANPSHHNIIQGNTLLDSYYYGVFLGNTSNTTVSGNDISRPTRTVFTAFYGIAAGIGSSSVVNTNLLIEKNRIHNVFDAARPDVYNFYAIAALCDGASSGVPNKVENNLVYNIDSDASMYGITGKNANNWNYYHNTLVFDGTAASGIATVDGINVSGTAVHVKNNLVYITSQVAGRKSCLNYAVNGVGSSDYNVLYINSGAGVHNNIGYIETDYATLAAWQASAKAYDLHSVVADPLFASPVTGDFTPTEPAIDNTGTALGITTDIVETMRNASTPDPGAYEFSSVLPVIWTNFNGFKTAEGNKLEWNTATEVNNAGFEIMRSADGARFESIGKKTSNAPNGNSNSWQYYSFTDAKTAGGAWYYQLKQLDHNGKARYSRIIFIAGDQPTTLSIDGLYPNPATQMLYLRMYAPVKATVKLQVTDMAGRQVTTINASLAAGDNTVQIPVEKLGKGTYMVKAICADGCQSTARKFIKH